MGIHIESDGGGGTTSSVDSDTGNVEKTVTSRTTSIACQDTGDHLSVEIDMPGISVDGLDVSLTGRRLTATYEKEKEERTEEDGVARVVKVQESIRKEVDLPVDVDPQSVDAVYKRGVLVVKLRKRPLDDEAGERVIVNVK